MKVIFILSAMHQQRCMKRIDEFCEQGYDVEAYGFEWLGEEIRKTPKTVIIEKIGNTAATIPYYKRSSTFYKGIRHVLKKHKKDNNVLYYVFGLDMAIFFNILSNRQYIYEESDLMHTYLEKRFLTDVFELFDKIVIKKSLLTVFTSEGFIRYHFGNKRIENSFVIPNRLARSVKKLNPVYKSELNINHLNFGFVGYIRFNSIYAFAETVGSCFPNHNFHFFGVPHNGKQKELFMSLKKYKNCFFHGSFTSPDDLPEVYSQIDIVLSTYDIKHDNVKYAEPNKIYEAIYFKTPIVVTKGTYLAEKVKELNIGYDIDPLDREETVSFISKLSMDSICDKIVSINKIEPEYAINSNVPFFELLKQKINAI